jgi:RecJ-like exonuclease
MNTCTKCNGTGTYQGYGVCFRCGGTGGFSKKTSKEPKYKIGDTIQKNSTKRTFTIIEITNKHYVCDDKTRLGRHIDNYDEISKDGYTKIQ